MNGVGRDGCAVGKQGKFVRYRLVSTQFEHNNNMVIPLPNAMRIPLATHSGDGRATPQSHSMTPDSNSLLAVAFLVS